MNTKSKIVNRESIIIILVAIFTLNACSDWLDIVPDGVATLDMAFNSREQARKYLGTCYSYRPSNTSTGDPAILGCDELWTQYDVYANGRGLWFDGHYIAMGRQSASSPMLQKWSSMYQALRDCNTFLDNIVNVPDLYPGEMEHWTAEVKVLKAYYHFLLVQMYGPIPLIRENLPTDVDVSSVAVVREPVDECFRYIVELLDEAIEGERLQIILADPNADLGRITKPIAMALKAKVLVYAASDLFNGNSEQATLRNRDGTALFNTTFELEKWEKAVVACKEAIDVCHRANLELYYYPQNLRRNYTDTIATQYDLRNAFNTRWNSEIIWANTQSLVGSGNGSHVFLTIPILDERYYAASNSICRFYGPPIKIVESLFYSHNGVPLDEDKTRDISKLYNLRTAQDKDRLYIEPGSMTVDMHFDREPRFYAWVGFDGGIWYGSGRYDDKDRTQTGQVWRLGLKIGEVDGTKGVGNPTGYLPKKYIPIDALVTATNSVSSTSYAWPLMRLSDLYLMYAEAINEAEGPHGSNSAELFRYIDAVRARAGLMGVKDSWGNYSTNMRKYDDQIGLREIIRQERMIELCFEGHRFWDIRRWKIAHQLYRTPIQGWNTNVDNNNPNANQIMYTPQLLFDQKFNNRDYFWPINNGELNNNVNLVQNIGW